MGIIKKFKIFESLEHIFDPEYYLDDIVGEYDLSEYNKKKLISEVIERVKKFTYPFEAYLLEDNEDDRVWTTDIVSIINSENSRVFKTTANENDVDLEQTIRGRLLELDHRFYGDSNYICLNQGVDMEYFTLSFNEDIEEIFYLLSDNGVTFRYNFFNNIKDTNIFDCSISSENLLPKDDIVTSLLRLDDYLKSKGFDDLRPYVSSGHPKKNISFELVGNYYQLTLDSLLDKTSEYTDFFPFRSLNIKYYKPIN